jgi:hypothetical protein
MTIELKIKAKSLAVEARIIRREELKLKRTANWYTEHQQAEEGAATSQKRQELYEHRIGIVRWESRATQLARGFIKGLAYSDMERPAYKTQKAGELPHEHGTRIDPYTKGKLIGRVHKLLMKYHDKAITADAVTEWFDK